MMVLRNSFVPSYLTHTLSSPESELHSRAAPSVEAHHRSVGPDTGRNSGGRQIKKTLDNQGC